MNQFYLSVFALSMLGVGSLSFAGTQGASLPTLTNQVGYYLGLGASYNLARLSSNISGSLNAISGFPPIGVFSGSTGSYTNKYQSFAPEAQIGYFRNFSSSNWLWGIELMYQYTNTSNTAYSNPRSITLLNPAVNITNTINLSAVQTQINNELILPIFIGYSFANSFIYLGAGPSLFNTQKRVLQMSDTQSALYVGTINGFTDKQWVWGGAIQAGMAYYINPSWFFKLNYTYAVSSQYSTNNTAIFSSVINQGLNTGSLNLYNQQRLTNQDVAFSINKLFSL